MGTLPRLRRGGQEGASEFGKQTISGYANYVRCTNYVRSANYVRRANYGELRPSLESALPQNTPDYEISSWIFFLQVGFFSLCENWQIFFSPELYFYKKRKKERKKS